MKLNSPVFENGGDIPSKYTCQGDDISPELLISDVSEKAVSLILIMDDPDAPNGMWDHWVVFNIALNTTKISEGQEPPGVVGKNSWENTVYGGPYLPSGTHRYFFKLYALDIELDLPQGSSKSEVESAMEGHVLENVELVGKYQKS